MKDVVFGGPAKWNEIKEIMRGHGVDLGFITPLTREGGVAEHATLKAMLRSSRYSKVRKGAEVVNAIALSMFNGAEKLNRVVTWWASYNKHLTSIGAKGAAAKATTDMFRTQFDYSMGNMPQVLRGPVGALLLQFKSFFINELEFVAGLRGKEIAKFGLAMQTLGGLAIFTNIPGGDLVDKGKAMFFNSTFEEDLTMAAENGFMKWTAFGFPGLVGIDLHDYVGVGGFGELARGFLGPIGSDIKALKDYVRDVAADNAVGGFTRDETTDAFLRKILPSAIRRAETGFEIAKSGEVRDPYTRKLVYKPAARLREAITAGIGAPTIELQIQRSMDRVHNRVVDRWTRSRTALAKEAALAYLRGEPENAQEILRRAKASGFPISGQSFRYWVKELQRESGERRRRRTPPALRSREDMVEYWEANGALPIEVERGLARQ
jgi:hypothetical protein